MERTLLKITFFVSPVKMMKCRLDPLGTTQSMCVNSLPGGDNSTAGRLLGSWVQRIPREYYLL